MTEPTDAEIIALADETRTAEGGANGYILPISFARAVLAKWGTPPAVAGEPVAWEYCWKDTSPFSVTSGQWTEWRRVEARSRLSTAEDAVREFQQYIADGLHYELRPLYTTPQPTQSQAGAVPLTDGQIRAMCKESWVFETAKQWVRITEQHHGITGGQHGAE